MMDRPVARLRAAMRCTLAALALSAIGGTPAPAQRPNFVMIIADDMSWSETSAYGHSTIRTPNLQRLAREGLRFEQGFVTTSSCSPSRASIITGRYPHNTGAGELHLPVPAEQVTFVELLRKSGYWAAAVGKWHLGDALKDRFDLVEEPRRRPQGADAVTGGADVSGAEGWVEALQRRPRDRPFLLWLGALDPHREYHAGAIPRPHRPEDVRVPPYLPDTPGARRDLAMYYDEISRLDGNVGDVLAELERQGVADNTVVLFISDNGMPFPRSKTTLYDSGIRIPFLLRWPRGIAAGGLATGLVSSVDIAPTFLELAGLPRAPTFQGTSFAPVLRQPSRSIREHVFAEKNWHDYGDRSRAVRTARFKYVRNDHPELANTPPADAVRSPTYTEMRALRDRGALTPEQRVPFTVPRAREELYDLTADPFELRNVAGDPRYSAQLAGMRSTLATWQRETDDRRPAKRRPDGFDRETGLPLPESDRQPRRDNPSRSRPRTGATTGNPLQASEK